MMLEQERLQQEEAVASSQADSAQEALGAQEQRAEDQARLEQALAQLNPRYRQALELRFLENRTRKNCATTLAIKMGTFDVLLHRALGALRKAWDADAARETER